MKFAFITYILIGLLQIAAIVDGVEHLFGFDSIFGTIIAIFIGMFITYIPMVGAAAGIYGAVESWGWGIGTALLVFLWYVPVAIAFHIYLGLKR